MPPKRSLMANYIENIRTPSQNIPSSQGGSIFIDEAQGRLVVFDGTNNRMVVGLYKGEVVIAVSKVGEDVFAALDG